MTAETPTPLKNSNAPEVIYLQDGNPDDPDAEPLERDFYVDEVSWCAEQINDGDTKYIRFDLHERDLAECRARAIEECAKKICPMCQDGKLPVQFGVVFKNASFPAEWYHLEIGGSMNGEDLAYPCDAADIRDLVEPPALSLPKARGEG